MNGAVWHVDELTQARVSSGELYLQFFKNTSMRMGIYELEAGTVDPQMPHEEDEAYFVLKGRATISIDGVDHMLRPGSVVLVLAHVVHKFHSIAEDLAVLVFFSAAAPGARLD